MIVWHWSLSFIQMAFSDTGHLTETAKAALCVATLNMLMQVTLSMLFGDKSVLKIRGKR